MENELLRKVKDEVAQANHFADWFQIDMTDMEQCQRDEIKAMMLDDVAIKYAEAYHVAKSAQKQHLVELMKMDEEKTGPNILALMQLAVHIQQMDKHMATQFQAHDYRLMWDIWCGVSDMVNDIENNLKQKLNGTTNG